VKLVHLVGFIVKKFITMHDHMNLRLDCNTLQSSVPQINIQSFVACECNQA